MGRKRIAIVVPAELDGDPTDGPWVIREPLQKLRAKYLSYPERFHSLHFDLYVHQRAVAKGRRNDIDGSDICATLLMNSGVDRDDLRALVAAAPEVKLALTAIPDIDLEDADLEKLSPPLRSLFAAVRTNGVSIAKCTKLLCMKRPRLIPMLDAEVVRALCKRAPQLPANPQAFASRVVDLMGRFQSLLRARAEGALTNGQACESIASSFSREVRTHLEAHGLSGPFPTFSAVRVLDNLLWFDWYGYATFGYEWNRKNEIVEQSVVATA